MQQRNVAVQQFQKCMKFGIAGITITLTITNFKVLVLQKARFHLPL